jgi:pimeloyl-ACP methyl ester carboxylesterase
MGSLMKISSIGVQLNVSEQGKGDIALVFLHYWGGSARTWNPVTDSLSKEFRSIAIDLRGWGESEKPVSGYSIRNQADDVEGVVRQIGLNRYYLVGHSMGAKIAEVLASRKPKGLEGLILVAGASPTPSKIPLERRNAMVHVYDSRESILGAINNVLTFKKLTAEIQEQVIEDSLKGGKEAKHAWPTSGMVEDISDVFDIRSPTLIIAGDKDKVDNPEMLKTDLLPKISGARFHSIPDVGHLLPLEAPEEVAKAVRDFIRHR